MQQKKIHVISPWACIRWIAFKWMGSKLWTLLQYNCYDGCWRKIYEQPDELWKKIKKKSACKKGKTTKITSSWGLNIIISLNYTWLHYAHTLCWLVQQALKLYKEKKVGSLIARRATASCELSLTLQHGNELLKNDTVSH